MFVSLDNELRAGNSFGEYVCKDILKHIHHLEYLQGYLASVDHLEMVCYFAGLPRNKVGAKERNDS